MRLLNLSCLLECCTGSQPTQVGLLVFVIIISLTFYDVICKHKLLNQNLWQTFPRNMTRLQTWSNSNLPFVLAGCNWLWTRIIKLYPVANSVVCSSILVPKIIFIKQEKCCTAFLINPIQCISTIFATVRSYEINLPLVSAAKINLTLI